MCKRSGAPPDAGVRPGLDCQHSSPAGRHSGSHACVACRANAALGTADALAAAEGGLRALLRAVEACTLTARVQVAAHREFVAAEAAAAAAPQAGARIHAVCAARCPRRSA